MNSFFVRTAGAVSVVSLATFLLGLTPFLAAEPTAGADLTGKTQDVVVNRSLKGDRLPVANSPASNYTIGSEALRLRLRSQQGSHIPVGCDAAFSPVSSPELAYVYRRCMT